MPLLVYLRGDNKRYYSWSGPINMPEDSLGDTEWLAISATFFSHVCDRNLRLNLEKKYQWITIIYGPVRKECFTSHVSLSSSLLNVFCNEL